MSYFDEDRCPFHGCPLAPGGWCPMCEEEDDD